MATVISVEGSPLPTVRVVLTNTSKTIQDSLNLPSGCAPISLLVTCETNSCRIAMGGSTPSQAVGHILTSSGSMRVSGSESVRTFKACNATAGSESVLQVTAFCGT
jgi:hypothetical protein